MQLLSPSQTNIREFFKGHNHAILVEIIGAKGSTPREKNTWMMISQSQIYGTIGGGQLEYIAIDKARQILRAKPEPNDKNSQTATLNIPLGPEIGQCCGGFVDLSFTIIDERLRSELIDRIDGQRNSEPHLYIFGAGHVGLALARSAVLMPLAVKLVDTRAGELSGAPEQAEAILTALPETIVRSAPAQSAFVILTHDHALDFLLTKEALERGDAAYVGMIGSKTKRGTFQNWFKREDGDVAYLSQLICPIGNGSNDNRSCNNRSNGKVVVKDKRPAIIAALTLSEVITHLFGYDDKDHVNNRSDRLVSP